MAHIMETIKMCWKFDWSSVFLILVSSYYIENDFIICLLYTMYINTRMEIRNYDQKKKKTVVIAEKIHHFIHLP